MPVAIGISRKCYCWPNKPTTSNCHDYSSKFFSDCSFGYTGCMSCYIRDQATKHLIASTQLDQITYHAVSINTTIVTRSMTASNTDDLFASSLKILQEDTQKQPLSIFQRQDDKNNHDLSIDPLSQSKNEPDCRCTNWACYEPGQCMPQNVCQFDYGDECESWTGQTNMLTYSKISSYKHARLIAPANVTLNDLYNMLRIVKKNGTTTLYSGYFWGKETYCLVNVTHVGNDVTSYSINPCAYIEVINENAQISLVKISLNQLGLQLNVLNDTYYASNSTSSIRIAFWTLAQQTVALQDHVQSFEINCICEEYVFFYTTLYDGLSQCEVSRAGIVISTLCQQFNLTIYPKDLYVFRVVIGQKESKCYCFNRWVKESEILVNTTAYAPSYTKRDGNSELLREIGRTWFSENLVTIMITISIIALLLLACACYVKSRHSSEGLKENLRELFNLQRRSLINLTTPIELANIDVPVEKQPIVTSPTQTRPYGRKVRDVVTYKEVLKP